MSSSAELPFVAAPAGDLAALTPVAIAAAHAWGLPAPTLLRLGMNAVFAAGDEVVLRVSRPTAAPVAALELARALLDAGLPVPRPVRDEPFIDGDVAVFAFEQLHPSGAPIDWAAVGRIVRRLHGLDPSTFPVAYPSPRGSSFPWWDLDTLVTAIGPAVDTVALRSMRACVERHRATMEADRTAPTVVCHGDVHPGNVVQTASGPVLLDWDLLCREPIGWDHGPLITWTERWGGEPGVYEAFAAGYGADLRSDRFAVAFAELRLLAATLMRVRAGLSNAAAAEEAERRLRWWRGDPDAPPWTAA